jgi:AraC-like DNA-binding protein
MFLKTPYHIKTIAEYHKLMDLSKPEHPLISVIKFENIIRQPNDCPNTIIHNFYSIALKKNFTAKMIYGQQEFDFDEGVMHFMSPKQVLSIQASNAEEFKHLGWLLLIHPDFLWNTALSKKIKQYEFFSYNVNEALHLSEKEEILVTDIIENIAKEYHTQIDRFSQDVILSQIDLLLTYSERFYQRQFITRKIANHRILNQLDAILSDYFKSDNLSDKGIPTVQYIADNLNVSANYLSKLLQLLTGQSTQKFIHDKLIDLAKEELSTTDLTVKEIAFKLGFEHPQSFNKLFKSKTKVSPLEFRQSFN